jgi:hypothetical protein
VISELAIYSLHFVSRRDQHVECVESYKSSDHHGAC